MGAQGGSLPVAADEPGSRRPATRAAVEPAPIRISVSLPLLDRLLAGVLLVLLLLGVGAEVAVHVLGAHDLYGLVPLVDLSYEDNLPTWYSALLLLGCAGLLASAGAVQRERRAPYVARWKALAVIFLYIAVDEAVSIHELVNQFIDLHGVLYFGWVIPAGIAVALLGLAYLPFLAHLPAATRRRFLCAAGLYVGGALGVELVLGYWTDLHGDDNLVYGLIDAAEESLEMAGLSLFFSALCRHLARRGAGLLVTFTREPAAFEPTR